MPGEELVAVECEALNHSSAVGHLSHVLFHSVGKGRWAFSFLCAVSRSHNNDPKGSSKNKAFLGIQWN